MYLPQRISGPAEALITTATAKVHLRVTESAEDTLIDDVIASAVAHLDGPTGILGRCLVEQNWQQDFDSFDTVMRLPFPALTIVSVTYRNDVGATLTVSGTDYGLYRDDVGSYVQSKTGWPVADSSKASVSIRFSAGFGAASDVPADIRRAILLLVGAWFENREETAIGVSVSRLPESVSVRALVTKYRQTGVGD